LNLFPYPANNTLQIDFISHNNLLNLYDFFIVDVFGRKVGVKKQCVGIATFDVSKFKEGVYLVEIWNQSRRVSSKMFLKHD
jgi:hypothetical protein